MANPRQTRKRRSGISKATQKPRKHHKEILSQLRSGIGGDALNQIVARQWDPKETAARNYARLGLKAKLGKASGGVEKRVVGAESEGGAAKAGKQNGQAEEVQEARIVRDEETGEVRVLGGEGAVSQSSKKQTKRRRLEDPLNDILEDDSGSSDDDDERSGAAQRTGMINPHAPDGHIGAVARTKQATETWRQLHDAAEMAIQQRKSSNKKRKQSEREREWCQRLVEKHGNDYAAMARDIKVNVMQQSEGDLRKRIDLYLKTR